MADVILRPVVTPAGTVHRMPYGARCDRHPERPAATRLQGETDASGVTPLHDLCFECRDVFQEGFATANPLVCEVCNQPKADLQPWRDPEGGAAGPVLKTCAECRDASAGFYRETTDEGEPVNPEEQAERDLIASMGEPPPLLADPKARRRSRQQQLVPPTTVYRGGMVRVPVSPLRRFEDHEDDDLEL